MLQGFFKKSFSTVNCPILRSSSAIRRDSSSAGVGSPWRPNPGNADSPLARHSARHRHSRLGLN